MMCWSDCSLHFTQSSVDSESVAKMWLKTEETCQTDGQFFAHCSAPGMQANHRRRFESHAAGWNPKQAKRLEWGCPCRVGLWRLQNGNPNLWTCTCDTCAFVVICCRHLLSFVVICCHLLSFVHPFNLFKLYTWMAVHGQLMPFAVLWVAWSIVVSLVGKDSWLHFWLTSSAPKCRCPLRRFCIIFIAPLFWFSVFSVSWFFWIGGKRVSIGLELAADPIVLPAA